MRIIIKNMKINTRKFAETVNNILEPYNIRVEMAEAPAARGQEIRVYPSLIKPVKYSPYFSQLYDEERVAFAEKTGEFERNPKMKFGIKMKYLHWYHWAILNDVLTYILDNLGVDYVIKTAVGTYRGWREWRQQIRIVYYPQFDPAFNKRNTRVIKRFKGVPLYFDRAKMLDALDEVDTAVKAGLLKPQDIPALEEMILSITKAKDYYEGIPVPESISGCKPHYRAWLKMRYGSDAETMYYYMSDEERDKEYGKLMEWLEKVDPKSSEFKEYLELWKSEVENDIVWAIQQYGSYEEVLRDKDDAGFSFYLAKALRTTPFKPELDINTLRRKLIQDNTKEEESVSA